VLESQKGFKADGVTAGFPDNSVTDVDPWHGGIIWICSAVLDRHCAFALILLYIDLACLGSGWLLSFEVVTTKHAEEWDQQNPAACDLRSFQGGLPSEFVEGRIVRDVME
jgi:hypothetical protein